MRALITGINGFVGHHLETELRTRGWEVFGMSVEPPFNETVRKGDLLDAPFLTSLVNDLHPNVVFHLAGISSVKRSWEQPELTMRVNRDGTDSLYRALVSLATPVTMILVSSAEVYGVPKRVPLTELDPPNPTNPYAKSKFAAEKVSRVYPSIKTVITRSFLHIGPGQRPGFIVPDVAQQIVAIERGNAKELLIGNTRAQRDFTDVRDIVKAYILLAERGTPGQIYNVCSNVAYRISEIVDMLISKSMAKVSVRQDPSRMRPSDIPILQGDNMKLRTATGWTPRIPLGQTINDVLAYYRSLP
ncbi:MAG: GDP-mannose 4,6-dehydratase [Candidatus Kerfeldbacteria bacterium]